MRNIDILRTLAILFGFAIVFAYTESSNFINNINLNWDKYKCNPLVMPFAAIFGHDGVKNFTECITIQQKFSMGMFLAPIEYAISLAGNLGGDLTGSLNNVRGFFNYLRIMVIKTVKTIFNMVLSIIIAFIRIMAKTKDLTMKLLGSFVLMMHVMQGGIMTGKSLWWGPPGGVLRFLCFHPNTTVLMKNGMKKYMKDIRVGETLDHNNKVIGTLELQGSKTNSFYKIYSKRLQSDILVTGTHKIHDPYTGRFIPVSKFQGAKKTNKYSDKMACLITDDHLIPIGEFTFWDWED